MILGLDTGLATFGWATYDESLGELVDLGVVITKPEKNGKVTRDRARRLNPQADLVAEKARGCSTVVIEAMSFPPGGANAQVSIALSWGAALGVVAGMAQRPKVLTISPQKWQREILPGSERSVDYDALFAAAVAHIRDAHPRGSIALEAIKPRDRFHAVDAAMLALVGALNPGACDIIVEPRTIAPASVHRTAIAIRAAQRPLCAICGDRNATTVDDIDGKSLRVCFECKEWTLPEPKLDTPRDRVLRALGRMDGEPDLAELCAAIGEDGAEDRERISQVLGRAIGAGLVGCRGNHRNRTYFLIAKGG